MEKHIEQLINESNKKINVLNSDDFDIDEKVVLGLFPNHNTDNKIFAVHHLNLFNPKSSNPNLKFSFLTRKKADGNRYEMSLMFINEKKFLIYETSRRNEMLKFINNYSASFYSSSKEICEKLIEEFEYKD